ncbi:MAG: S-methyl-5'-thioadenosine phosphorylase [Caulobacteraceae bacterium]|jgi:5'-methylthioadenosine phosphorylase|nr:S-methyl-5'-thioadenosine phosphorylase [Caulobacteraceae bacterium]
MTHWRLGVIGGSGLYELDGLENRRWNEVETPWGAPSDAILTGELEGVEMAFLPRHGRGHTIPPGELNARANIAALKQLGCTDLLSISAVGSLQEALSPGTFVVVDQYIDRTVARPSSFFGPGIVAHVSLADPVCPRLSDIAFRAGQTSGATMVQGGTYVAMEGPQFSTRAESRMFRSWGCDVIGMTGMPEARLAREAELPYACVGMVTDYDCWRPHTADVQVTDVLAVLKSNAATARSLLRTLVRSLPERREPSPIDTTLDMALITAPDLWEPTLKAKLATLCPRKFA